MDSLQEQVNAAFNATGPDAMKKVMLSMADRIEQLEAVKAEPAAPAETVLVPDSVKAVSEATQQ